MLFVLFIFKVIGFVGPPAGMGAGDEVSESSGGEGVKVNIRCSNGTKFSVDIDLESSVETFKAALAEKCEVPPQQQRLIYKGRILKDDQTLKSYGTIQLIIPSFF